MFHFLLRWSTVPSTILAFLLFFATPFFLQAQQGYQAESKILRDARLSENVEIRQLAEQTLLDLTFERASVPSRFYIQKSSPISVTLFISKGQTEFFLDFVNNIPTTERQKKEPRHYTRGSYFFEKNLSTNEFTRIKVFIQDNQDSYILVEPEDDYRSRLSVFIYGNRFYSNIPVPMGMRSVSISPLAKLMAVTRYQVDWASLFQPAAYPEWQTVRWMIDQIQPQLAYVRLNGDGAQDEHGNFVFIENLQAQPTASRGFNCSGFVKWIIDGLYKPLTQQGNLIPIEPLKREGLRESDNRWNDLYSELRDPYFGLDWIRNLAYAIRKARWPLQQVDLYSEDARNTNFSTFFNDIGYPLENIESALYELAIKHPGEIFLGSISTEFGAKPVLRQHRHVATFFPYFDDYGNFRISVFDLGYERSISSLVKAFPTGFVYFVRVEASRDFALPALPTETTPTTRRVVEGLNVSGPILDSLSVGVRQISQ